VDKARRADNLVKLDNELGEIFGVHLGCVVRVESIRQDPTTSLWGKSCPRGATWASLARGTCGGYMCEVDQGVVYPWWRCHRGTGCWLSS
jgi:hypothetical protein